jgi:hypothetical protein
MLYEGLAFYADRNSYKNILIYPERNAGAFSDDCRHRPGWDGPRNLHPNKPRPRPHYGHKARETFRHIKRLHGDITNYIRVKEKKDVD